jgi:hypothetical protein
MEGMNTFQESLCSQRKGKKMLENLVINSHMHAEVTPVEIALRQWRHHHLASY